MNNSKSQQWQVKKEASFSTYKGTSKKQVVVTLDQKHIATVYASDRKFNALENAELIASAPKLKTALELLKHIANQQVETNFENLRKDFVESVLLMCDAALKTEESK